ncbi:YceI family protein [Actinomadura flavalba]|uniref:YceI family protein n=1 Tax=Actinomadura flavalba TaxID=1120938 RepID=UPI000373431F|nr:YceI family protein [Actinomadura flavalba]
MTTGIVEIPGYVAGTWVIDPAHSTVGFTVRHLGISKVRGRFGAVDGTIVTAADPLESSVTATIDVASVDTGTAQRDAHLRSPDFFDAARHPAITFASTGLRADGDAFALDGDLTVRDVTRPVTLRLELDGIGPDAFLPDPSQGARAGFTATGEVDRLEFGVGDSAKGPAGGLFLGQKVQVTLEIQAALQRAG